MGGGIAAQKTSGDLSHPRRPLRVGSLIVLVSLLASLLLRPALALEGKPKFGPNAAPILEQTAYLRTAAAPDYWKLNPFYVSQTTSLCITDDLERLLGRQHHDGDQLHARIARWRRRTDRHAIVAAEEDR